ncbi:hypothetical protein GCM10011379_36700 [Filimonas zeae]|uniref:Bacterial surface antigen (D15) domain-containing protein n=2 Tax=Filimonas zeae TaxID=1737353 RepID=A0A917J0I7_9BACT|nr:hypothetical protein GCM10011379_36700 [Filimonas zeae]
MMPQNKQNKDTARQTDLIDVAKKLFHISPQKPRNQEGKRIYFSILPFGGTLPGGTGRALITSTTAGIYLGPRRTTYISTASFAPYWNFKGRFGLPLRTSIWLPDNTWTIQGDTRFMVYPQYTWGLGNIKGDYENRVLVNYKYIRFYQSALKRIKPYLFAGLGYHLDYRFNIASDNPVIDLTAFTKYNYGLNRRSFSSGISGNLLYDTRNNAINPLPGAYANLVYRINPTFLGSNNNWQSVYLDLRKYVSLNKARPRQQNMIAFWSYLWTAFGNTPYLDLPSTGWDPYNRSARGIDQNRYRGKSLLYLESEYRRDITNNGLFGFVVFANANTVSGAGKFGAAWHPAAGAGLRVKFNKGSNTNIGIDYGFSKGYSNIMLNLGEAF